tara:strand:- start:213 stop:512 length:300 start_codon:yes stop_codon:yes gene_type:complete
MSLTLSQNHPSWNHIINDNFEAIPIIPKEKATCRQDLSKVYILNGALYLGSKDFFLREKSLFTTKTLGFVMPKSRSIDIDNIEDWDKAEILQKKFGNTN